MTDATILKPKQAYILALLDSKAVMAVIGILAGIATTLTTQHFTAPAKPLRIQAADSIATPAPAVNVTIDMAPIARAISDGIAGFRAEMAQARESAELARNLKSVRGRLK